MWKTNTRPNGKVSIVDENGKQICLMWNDSHRDKNAALICRAPDMEEVLKQVNNAIKESVSEINLADRIVALSHSIAEALGCTHKNVDWDFSIILTCDPPKHQGICKDCGKTVYEFAYLIKD